MTKIISLKKAKAARKKGRYLCGEGFHKWRIWKEKQFDVKEGKLVTVFRCQHCGKEKTQVL